MVIKGKCRGNGLQLAEYLLSDKNDRAELLEITGTTAPNNLKRSLVEMGLTALMTKSEAGLYHAQINPDPKEPGMTKEAWKKAVDILAKELGLEGQRRAIVLHEKNGRTHAHVVFERYQEGKGKNEQGILWSDDKNYKKHEKASRAIEKALGHERTPEKADRQKQTQNERKTDVKKTLTELWQKHSDPEKFIAEAAKLGFTVAQGEDRRPYKVITPEGENLDLVRQLEKIKTKEVAERLNPIRETLKTEKEALAAAKKREQEKPQQKKEPAPAKPANDNMQDKAESLHKLGKFKTNEPTRPAEKEAITTEKKQEQVKEQPPKEQAPPVALKWDLGKVQTSSNTPPAKPANDNMQEKTENLHKLGKFKTNEATKPQEQQKQPAEPVKPQQAEKSDLQKKIDEMRANEAEILKEVERRKQLTDEERKAEDKKRFEEYLKQMQQDQQEMVRKLGM